MAGPEDLLKKLTLMIRALDDAAYLTYASKGLLRRARKNMSAGAGVRRLEMNADEIVFEVDNHQVKMGDRGPLNSVCTCPAPDACVHILMACLHLDALAASDAGEIEPAAAEPAENDTKANQSPANAEWLAISAGKLRKWAGADAYRKAWRLLETHEPAVKTQEVRFENSIKCRFIAGAGLDGLITNAPPKEQKSYATAAVLAFQIEHGLAPERGFQEPAARDGIDGSLAGEIRQLLGQMIRIGLNHLSPAFVQRIHQLAVLCRTGRLFRPAKELESCAREIEWIINRHARADIPGLFNKMARLYALAVSVANQAPHAPPKLTGTARSTYYAVDAVSLVGLGIYPWETASGFTGLTALFWSPEMAQFFSWSDSRPNHATGGFTPHQRYEEESPWSGGKRLKDLGRSSFVLENPRINQQRRLSSYQGCRVKQLTSRIDPSLLPRPFTRWSKLRDAMQQSQKLGLSRGAPLDALCVIQPHRWLKPVFDEIEQQLIVPLEDEENEKIFLHLPFTKWTEAAVYYLEAGYAGQSDRAVVGYFSKQPVEGIFPVSIIRHHPDTAISDLLFTPLPKKKIKWKGLLLEKIRPFLPLPEFTQKDVAKTAAPENDIALFLSPLDDFLLAAAESGFQPGDKGMPRPAVDLAGAGFLLLDADLKNLTSEGDILMARYHYLLHLDAIGIER